MTVWILFELIDRVEEHPLKYVRTFFYEEELNDYMELENNEDQTFIPMKGFITG